MGVSSVITQLCTQIAVYWPNPIPDGYGQNVFSAPIEIKCRWQESTEEITKNDGDTIVSMAVVYVLQDVIEEGVLFLGTLSDLTTAQKTNPKLQPLAFIVQRFDKSPVLKSTNEFLRKAYL